MADKSNKKEVVNERITNLEKQIAVTENLIRKNRESSAEMRIMADAAIPQAAAILPWQ